MRRAVVKERVVEVLTSQGHRFKDGAWSRRRVVGADFDLNEMMTDADAMHALLISRADALVGCAENSEEAAELDRIIVTMERYEAKRRPQCRVVGGKG